MLWSVVLFGTKTWTERRKEAQYSESFEMWRWRRLQSIKWTDKIKSDQVLERVKEGKCMLHAVMKMKVDWLGHILKTKSILKVITKGRIIGKTSRGRKKHEMLTDLRGSQSYKRLKRATQDRDVWKWLFH